MSHLDGFIGRREAIRLGLAAAATGMLAPRTWAASGEAGLVVRNARPLDAESPIEALRTFDTRNDLFFVRSHHGPPQENATPWTLTIDGEVARPVTLSLDD